MDFGEVQLVDANMIVQKLLIIAMIMSVVTGDVQSMKTDAITTAKHMMTNASTSMTVNKIASSTDSTDVVDMQEMM